MRSFCRWSKEKTRSKSGISNSIDRKKKRERRWKRKHHKKKKGWWKWREINKKKIVWEKIYVKERRGKTAYEWGKERKKEKEEDEITPTTPCCHPHHVLFPGQSLPRPVIPLMDVLPSPVTLPATLPVTPSTPPPSHPSPPFVTPQTSIFLCIFPHFFPSHHFVQPVLPLFPFFTWFFPLSRLPLAPVTPVRTPEKLPRVTPPKQVSVNSSTFLCLPGSLWHSQAPPSPAAPPLPLYWLTLLELWRRRVLSRQSNGYDEVMKKVKYISFLKDV